MKNKEREIKNCGKVKVYWWLVNKYFVFIFFNLVIYLNEFLLGIVF